MASLPWEAVRMADYRFYCMNSGGHIGSADWIQAETDEAAIAQARRLNLSAQRCEIWHKTRLIARLDPGGETERFEPQPPQG